MAGSEGLPVSRGGMDQQRVEGSARALSTDGPPRRWARGGGDGSREEEEGGQGSGEAQDGAAGVENGGRTSGKHGSIVVSPRQRGNPILRYIRSVPWEFRDVSADYLLGQTTCALFLSLRYHGLNPDYIHQRLQLLGKDFALRVLLVQVDTKNPHDALKELARISLLADCTLILAWSAEEAGRYLESYKVFENKPADILKERVERDFVSRITDCLTSVKSVNRTDCLTLINAFKTLAGVIDAPRDELSLCPGLGPQKARRIHELFREPFLRNQGPGRGHSET